MTHTSEISPLDILIVEDNRTQAEYLRHILEKNGHHVISAGNGNEALERVKESTPDIILTDIMMPDMDGYELCHTIKQNKETSSIPVVLITHLYSPEDVIKGLEVGADNFIIKPYEPEYIFSRINSIMQSKNHPDVDSNILPLDVVFSSEVHTISSSRTQILNILLSTYETAVKKNSELQVAHERLHYVNAQLQKAVEDLQHTNETLHLKNLERGRLEVSLSIAIEKLDLLSEITSQILHSQVERASGLLETVVKDKDVSSSSSWSSISDAYSTIRTCVIALRHTRTYQRNGVNPKVWQNVRQMVSKAMKQASAGKVRCENLIPEDVELLADSCIGRVISGIISSSLSRPQKPTVIRFSLQVQQNGYSVIFEDDGEGIPDELKEKIFLREQALQEWPDLYLSKEVLGLSGITVKETGAYKKGGRYEFFCPEGSVRFSGNLLNT